MDEKAPKRKLRGSLLIKIAVICLTAIALVSLMQRQIQIAEKRQQLEQLQTQLAMQEMKNSELSNALENEEGLRQYAEKRAREELDYVKPNERVFIDGD